MEFLIAKQTPFLILIHFIKLFQLSSFIQRDQSLLLIFLQLCWNLRRKLKPDLKKYFSCQLNFVKRQVNLNRPQGWQSHCLMCLDIKLKKKIDNSNKAVPRILVPWNNYIPTGLEVISHTVSQCTSGGDYLTITTPPIVFHCLNVFW